MNSFKIRPGTITRWEAFNKLISKEVNENDKVLDLGGFDGYFSFKLKKIMPELDSIVVDTDKQGLKIAKKRGLKTVNASALNLPFENNVFNVVLCFSLIEHIKNEQKLVEEMKRVLKRGGKIFLITPKENGVNFPFISKKANKKINIEWGHNYRLGYSSEELDLLFNKYGFSKKIRIEYYNELTKILYLLLRFSNSYFSPIKPLFNILYILAAKIEPHLKYKTDSQLIIFEKRK